MKRKRKYWYFIEIHECPVCGCGHTYRERRYGKKPKDYYKRSKWVQCYDYCIERDMGY